MKLLFTNEAAADLADIYVFSVERFGQDQADKYYAGLENRFDQLLDRPEIGRDFSFVVPNVKRTNYESHAIYFKMIDDSLLVMRVLHQKQDPARHLTLTL